MRWRRGGWLRERPANGSFTTQPELMARLSREIHRGAAIVLARLSKWSMVNEGGCSYHDLYALLLFLSRRPVIQEQASWSLVASGNCASTMHLRIHNEAEFRPAASLEPFVVRHLTIGQWCCRAVARFAGGRAQPGHAAGRCMHLAPRLSEAYLTRRTETCISKGIPSHGASSAYYYFASRQPCVRFIVSSDQPLNFAIRKYDQSTCCCDPARELRRT
jgi:hypothetical protein